VHAYTLSLNHFHLLVYSPKGELSKAMHWIQNQYSRWFNRRRNRDGPLYRNRYGAKLVVSGVQWETLLWYIDRHPVKEGLAADPRDYPFGSAYHYARAKGPPWLTRKLIEGLGPSRALEELGNGAASSEGRRQPWEVLMELLDSMTAEDAARLDELVGASVSRTMEWMIERAEVADGVPVCTKLVDPETLSRFLQEWMSREPDWRPRDAVRGRTGWEILRIGLLRTVCRQSLAEIAARARVSLSTAKRMVGAHQHLLVSDPEYLRRSAEVVKQAFDSTWPKPRISRGALEDWRRGRDS
jgi:hypothetical protein